MTKYCTKIVHLTSAHPRYDTRIFIKMCCSLAKKYSVTLIVADGQGDEVKNNVTICDVGKSDSRIKRILGTTKRVFDKAVDLDADIYHLHDPELMPIGLKLKRLGMKVIFDAHEDLPKQLLSKPYLNRMSRLILSKLATLYENHACNKFDAIVAATPYIRDKFLYINKMVVDVNNFPILGELSGSDIDWNNKENKVCYIGGLEEVRGVSEIVDAISLTKSTVTLAIAGKFSDISFEKAVRSKNGWDKVEDLGWIGRDEIAETLSESIAGLVTLKPAINYLDSLPVKMFEYMSAGIPVIASNFPYWENIINESGCGLCVDPSKPHSIAEAIEYMVNNPKEAQEMGLKGLNSVILKYNWALEEVKLYRLYQDVLS